MNENEEQGQQAYFISEDEKHGDGGYRALIVTDGEKGYRRTEWNWGTDTRMAQQTCDMYNAALHVSKATAAEIQQRCLR